MQLLANTEQRLPVNLMYTVCLLNAYNKQHIFDLVWIYLVKIARQF